MRCDVCSHSAGAAVEVNARECIEQKMSRTVKEYMKKCMLCPRMCGVDRTLGQFGFCRSGDKASVALFSLHMWEEPCISGEEGSGTVFFTGCSLGCSFCQNHSIASGRGGAEITEEQLSDIFLA